MALLFALSARPSVPLPPRLSDKVVHFAAYAVLGVLATRAVGGGLPTAVGAATALAAWGIGSGYGALDEVHQLFVDGRSADVKDWYADATGTAIGVGLCWAWGIIAFRLDVQARDV